MDEDIPAENQDFQSQSLFQQKQIYDMPRKGINTNVLTSKKRTYKIKSDIEYCNQEDYGLKIKKNRRK